MVRSQIIALLSVIYAVGSLTSAAAQTCSRSELSEEAVEDCVNAVRKDPGAWAWAFPCGMMGVAKARPLSSDRVLSAAADIHSEDMSRNDFFSHTGSDGSSFSSRVWGVGYHGNTIGENLAFGYTNALDVVAGWMCSTGHRRNMMSCSYDEMGTSIDCSGTTCYVAQEYGCGGSGCCPGGGGAGGIGSGGGGFFDRLFGNGNGLFGAGVGGEGAGGGLRGIFRSLVG